MSTASKVRNSSGAKETVLLRKPAPKYGFAGRKLPNEPVKLPETPSSGLPVQAINSPLGVKNPQLSSSGTKSQQGKPVAVVGASFHSHALSVADFRAKGEYSGGISDQQSTLLFSSSASTPSLIANVQEEDHCQAGLNASRLSNTTTIQKAVLGTNGNIHCQSEWYLTDQNTLTSNTSLNAGKTEELDENTSWSIQSLNEQLQATKEERDKLRTELNAQLQVNAELKRLLVASVGDDLYERVENLCRDRAQLELDIGGFSKKMSEDYENLDKVSIQADMWRSKYLASRVMTEELSSAKAYFALQCHDSHAALQQLLNERQELRTNLVESYKTLQQVKNAFDPLNTHKSSSLRSTSVLSLSHACQQLSEAVRFRLLPANVAINVSADVSSEAWQDSTTRAEQFAKEILSRPIEGSSSNSNQDQHSSQTGCSSLHTRYHPATRYENLTMACCTRCRGEILVV